MNAPTGLEREDALATRFHPAPLKLGAAPCEDEGTVPERVTFMI